jgi:phage/plasmid-associated DNA primase
METFENLESELEQGDVHRESLEILKKLSLGGETYIYIKYLAKYMWVEKKKFFNSWEVLNNLMVRPDSLRQFRLSWDIATYNDLTYYAGWRYKSFNQLNEKLILLPSDNPVLDLQIKELIENVCWHKKENIDYLNKIILYKYSHLNDFTIPSIILFWVGWSWKWTLMTLFKTMYGEENVLANLGQRDLTSSFDTYRWCALIVEFAEVITNNTSTDKWILNKLKNIIGAEKLTINEKNIQAYQIENIAQVFISSNSNIPVLLDDKGMWNRRFSVIKSIKALKDWEKINRVIWNKKIVSDYLAWLHENYWEVLEYKSISALDNQDKRDLEELSQNEANKFWERLEDNYPDFYWKKDMSEMWIMIDKYCLSNAINEKEFYKFFWKNSKYPKKKIRIWKKTIQGVDIPETKKITIKEATGIFSSEDFF